MLLEWIGMGAAAPEVHDELQRRFMLGLTQRPSKDAPFSEWSTALLLKE